MSVGDFLIVVMEVGRASHSGQHHPLAGGLDCMCEERELASSSITLRFLTVDVMSSCFKLLLL